MPAEPARPRRIGRPPSGTNRDAKNLTRTEIVDAAIRIIGEVGVEKLSMRRLSVELGVSPMAPYHYVANRESLLDMVAFEALSGIRIPAPEDGVWHERLRALIDQIESRLHTYRGVGEVILDQILRGQYSIVDATMEILYEAGFDDQAVLAGYSMIHSYLFGRNRASRSDLDIPTDQELPPTVRRATSALARMRGQDFYTFGMDTLIAGLRTRVPHS